MRKAWPRGDEASALSWLSRQTVGVSEPFSVEVTNKQPRPSPVLFLPRAEYLETSTREYCLRLALLAHRKDRTCDARTARVTL
eukprot:3991872-Prymnesium_polylepis.1